MFFPFKNYQVIDIPTTNSESGVVVFTTSATSLLFFVPIGSRMEDDTPVSIFVRDYFTDTDGGDADLFLYRSKATTATRLSLNAVATDFGGNTTNNVNVGQIVPAGKQVVARVGDNSDRIGGTLYVLELP